MTALHASLLLLAAAALACGSGVKPPGSQPKPDDGAGVENPFPCAYPTSGYGSSLNKVLEPFTLPQCDGTPYSFVNEEFCASKLTVLSIAAGWCQPCMVESAMLTERVTNAYRDRGVRVLQVLIQNPAYGPPDRAFCEKWVADYNLVNVELMDVDGVIAPQFPSGSLPSTVIIDATGTIRHKEDGVSEGLDTLRAEIERLLEE